MAGIDNNTVLYLRGDSFNDLSLNPKTITNNGVLIDNNCFKFSASKRLIIDNNDIFAFGTNDFTVEMEVFLTNYSESDLFVSNNNYKDFYFNINPSGKLRFDTTVTTQYSTSTILLNTWSNVCISRKDGTVYMFINGKLQNNALNNGNITMTSPRIGYHDAYTSDKIEGYIRNLRVSNIARYIEDYVPKTSYNSLTINVTNKTFSQIDFNVIKLGQETINKVEVLQNNIVKETYTDNFDNLTFNHNNKNVKIVVTYDDVYTEELDVHTGNSKAKIYLYKEGNECESITGGWKDLLLRNQGGTITRTKEVDHLKVSTNITVGYPTNGGYVTSNTINFNKDVLSSELCYRYSLKRSTTNTTYYSNFALATYSDISTNNKEILTRYETYTTCEVGDNLIGNVDISNVQDVYVGFNAGHNNSTSETKVYEVYLETKENVISINSQNTSSINFSCNNLDNLITITKAEVYINNKLSKTYEDNFENLTYNIDNSLCGVGKNNISIKATYTQGDDISETVEEILTHTVTVNNLLTSSSLRDVIDRQELLNNSIEIQKNNLKNILVSKNVEVAEEENKLSSLIDKVNELGDVPHPPMFLYKDGNEYTDVTGGFVSHQTQSNPPTLTKTSSYMEYKAQSGSYTSGHYGTNLPINVTDYSLLKFEVETLNMGSTQYGCNFGLTTNKDMSSSVASIQITTNKSKHIISIDISSIKGLNYVYSDTTYNNTSRIYKIWLEA